MGNMDILKFSFCHERQNKLKVPLHIDTEPMPESTSAFSLKQKCTLCFVVVGLGFFVCLGFF